MTIPKIHSLWVYYENFASFRHAIQIFMNAMHYTHHAKLQTLLTLDFQMFTEEQIKNAA